MRLAKVVGVPALIALGALVVGLDSACSSDDAAPKRGRDEALP